MPDRDQDAAHGAEAPLRMGAEANAHARRPRVAGSTTRSEPSVDSHVDPTARRRVCLPSSVSAPPSVCWGVSRLSPGSISTSSTGEIVLLSGANGAGKTTLLRLLAGLVPLYSGEAMVLDHDLAVDRKRRSRATSRSSATRRSVTTTSPCGRTCASRRAPPGQVDDDADAALERLGLTRQADVVHRRLSAGQRRRLALAVAWSAIRGCCCSTSPTPGSTPTAGPSSTRSCAPRRRRRAPCSSHRTSSTTPRALATREVVITAGQAHLAARSEARGDALARGPARRGEGPADRGPLARHAAADRPVRADRAAAVRVRARPRPRHPAPGRARALLGDGAAGVAARGVALLQHRGRQRCARRPAPLGPRRTRALPRARPRPSRCSCCALEVVLAATRGARLRHRAEHAGAPDPGDPGRDRRRRGHRYPLRRARRGSAGARNPGAGAPAPGGGAGPPRRHPSLGSGDRRHTVGRVALGGAARRCSRCCSRRSGCWPSGRSWRKHERGNEREERSTGRDC